MDIRTLFWNAPLEDMKKGYSYNVSHKEYLCLICGKVFPIGEVFPVDQKFLDAEKMCEHHILSTHGSAFEYMISFNKGFTSLSDQQRLVLIHLQKNKSDQEIAQELKLSASTIRHYRFKFREKERQAKIFLALMAQVNKENDEPHGLIPPHRSATTLDERYHITESDKKNICARYFDETGKLLQLPSKEKRKIIVLSELQKLFSKGRNYSEKEINLLLSRVYDDYATLRRYLIEYGFVDRSIDGSSYWLND